MYSHEPPDYECPFCAVVGGGDNPPWVLQRDIVYRDEETTAWINGRWWPKNPGAVVIVPNRHVENIYGLEPDLAAAIHETARRIAIAMKFAFACDGTSTRQHNEPGGYQEVWHYHLHVFPPIPRRRPLRVNPTDDHAGATRAVRCIPTTRTRNGSSIDSRAMNELRVPLAKDFSHVLWLGGMSGVGKTTAARSIARRYDLRLYSLDARTHEHAARLPPETRTLDDIWVEMQPSALADWFEELARARFELVLDDLLALPRDAPVIVDGPQLVAPLLQSPGQAIYVVARLEVGAARRPSRARRRRARPRGRCASTSRLPLAGSSHSRLLGWNRVARFGVMVA